MFYTHDGLEVTADDIRQAMADDRCIMAHGYGNGQTTSALVLCESKEVAEQKLERDTRGETHRMDEAVWYRRPTIQEAFYASRGL